MYNSFIKPIEDLASTVFDGVADLFSDGVNLQFGPYGESVTLPDDLFAHADVQTEWWYYTGHCQTAKGCRFGFELVFFKRRTDKDRIGMFPVSLFANPMYAAHFAISDLEKNTFEYEHRRSFGNPLDIPVKASETSYDLRLGEWTFREVAGAHVLHAEFERGLAFDAVLTAAKPVVLNGDAGDGINRKMTGASNHFSFTRMELTGRLVDGNVSQDFTGSAWMDREYGTWEQKYWDWFSIQFDDDTELMIYQYSNEDGTPNHDSTGTFVSADGTCIYLTLDDYEIKPIRHWKSEKTGAEYPCEWRIMVPGIEIEIEIKAFIDDQELDTRGTTMIVYWEGACSVKGVRKGGTVSGRAYVELVGYDRSHEKIGLGNFLLTDPLRRLRRMF